jgi:hypothetical protein
MSFFKTFKNVLGIEIERPPYEVLEKLDENIEIRKYAGITQSFFFMILTKSSVLALNIIHSIQMGLYLGRHESSKHAEQQQSTLQ